MKLTFYGATQEVTGSCYLFQSAKSKILIDCGMIQGTYQDEKRNYQTLPFKASELDAVILTHAHIDHSGKLPFLVKNGFKGKIYTHHASKDLCEILLKDSAHIQEKDAEYTNKRLKKKIEPLYSLADVEQTMPLFHSIGYHERTDITDDVSISLKDAGHILGAAIVEFYCKEEGLQRKVVFSGDLGQPGIPIVRDPETVIDADLVLMESTYGDRCHRSYESTIDELKGIFEANQERHGNILIPAFAVGRTQDILFILKTYFDQWNLNHYSIFLDSPMAIRATEVYENHRNLYDADAKKLIKKTGSPYDMGNLHYCIKTEESMKINLLKNGCIIIAGSGMCNGGRIKHHLKHNIERKDAHLVFTGYQAYGTLGRKIIDGIDEIKLWGQNYKVNIEKHTLNGLSAHADQTDLLHWYNHFERNPPLVLVHGEKENMDILAEKLYQQNTIHPICAQYGDAFDLTKMRLIEKRG